MIYIFHIAIASIIFPFSRVFNFFSIHIYIMEINTPTHIVPVTSCCFPPVTPVGVGVGVGIIAIAILILIALGVIF